MLSYVATRQALQVPNIISTISPDAIGVQLAALGSGAAVPASTAWPTATKAIYIPFHLRRGATVKQLFCVNGGTAAGNIDMGIYDNAGARKVSIGSTAQAGTSTIQTFDIADTTLAAGTYYLAIAKDDAVGTVVSFSITSVVARFLRAVGLLEQTSAFALPATATFASYAAANFVPFCGLSLVTTY